MPEACASPTGLATLEVIALHVSHWESVHCVCPGGVQCVACVLLKVSALRVSLGAGASRMSHWESLHCASPARS